MAIAHDKKSNMRIKAQRRRQELSFEAREVAHDKILSHADAIMPKCAGKVVALYNPIRSEVDVLQLIPQLEEVGAKAICMPVVPKGKLAPLVFRVFDPSRLNRGYGGIQEPTEDCEAMTPEVLFVPLLGFDKGCMRLGYGAGHYDMTLATYKDAGHTPLTVGVAFGVQRFDDVPAKDHDVALDYILTDEAVYMRGEAQD